MAIQAAAVAVGKAVGAQVGEALLGSLLSAIGLGDSTGGDLLETAEKQLEVAEATLAEEMVQTELAKQNVELAKQSLEVLKQQLQTLNEISESLKQINTQLVDVNARLGAIQQALYEQFNQNAEQHTYHKWYYLHDKLYSSDTIINSALSDFTSFITPIEVQRTEDGETKTITKFPGVSAETKDSFIDTVINSPNSVSKQISAIDSLIQGIGGTPGILELYADLIIYDIIYPSEEQIENLAPGSTAYSNLLSKAVGRLVDYHSYLLSLQLKAILMELEVRQFVGDETAKNKWEQYLQKVRGQGKTFFNALWKIVKYWLREIEMWHLGQFFERVNINGPVNGEDPDDKIFSKADKSLLGTLLSGQQINDTQQLPAWLESAEQLIDAFSRPDPDWSKIVVHCFAFTGLINSIGTGMVVEDMQAVKDENKLLVTSDPPERFQVLHGSEGETLSWTTDLYTAAKKDGLSTFAWLRQEIDLFLFSPRIAQWHLIADVASINTRRIIDYGFLGRETIENTIERENRFFKVLIPDESKIKFLPNKEGLTFFLFNAYSAEGSADLPIVWPPDVAGIVVE